MTPADQPDLNREIESALEGVDLQSVDLPARPDAARKGGGAGRGGAAGHLARGTVVGLHGDDVIVELGPRVQGVISAAEFETPPAVGEVYEFSLQGQEEGLWLLSRRQARVVAAWDQLEEGAWVKAEVTAANPGGLELKVGPLPAFMPASHVDLRRVEDLAARVGQTIVCQVLEVDREKRRVLLSRRKVLEREAEERRRDLVASLREGQVVRGRVTRLEPFGAFVDLGGGVEGLVHVSNLSRRRVDKPDELLEVGQEVEAQVLSVQEGGRRIGLGMKQLEPDPWDEALGRLAPDQVVAGRVVRLMDFGAFVELSPGVEGLLHVSQMATQRLRRPQDAVAVGDEVQVRILKIEPGQHRISLSRLDSRGSLLGSEDAVEDAVIDDVLERSQESEPSGTNLGALFRRALGGERS